MADEISLPDHYVNLLERVIEENKSLREEARANAVLQQKVLEELNQNKASSSDSGKRPRSSKRASTKLIVPLLCRQDFRKTYKTLLKGESFKGFNMDESFLSFGSSENQEITM
ncbi:uncharacterized protein LOC116291075 [Actinia tenebrosa]|uniref:Uncharacterized protein LOC116291075 n=1 Tax=Actinia tenebrosa TaxID=6105 RepID=A0A6P8HC96_ACTTE|nr:uncharacterized protein LOC116291075 [Actinia tenebrosa]